MIERECFRLYLPVTTGLLLWWFHK